MYTRKYASRYENTLKKLKKKREKIEKLIESQIWL
jgi:hypothetical protein